MPMYFWRIENLKSAMAVRPLTDRESLPYLIASAALAVAGVYYPMPLATVWDGIETVCMFVAAILAVIYAYHRNGGADGQHFLQRYLAISWVIFIRLITMVLTLSIAFHGALSMAGIDVEAAAWLDAAIPLIFQIVLYWRVGHHIGDLAQRSRRLHAA